MRKRNLAIKQGIKPDNTLEKLIIKNRYINPEAYNRWLLYKKGPKIISELEREGI